jgi:hypothetical protein
MPSPRFRKRYKSENTNPAGRRVFLSAESCSARLHRQARRHARLGSSNLSGGNVKWKHHLKLASLSNHATHFDAAMMFLHDTAACFWDSVYC